MKNINLLVLLVTICFSCQSGKKGDRNIYTVTSFPIQQELKADVRKIDKPIFISRVMFVSNDYLYLYKEKDSTLFDIFKLPSCIYYSSTGIIGGGPDDFMLLDPRSFQPTEHGFKVMEAGTHILKSVILDDKVLKNEKTERILEGRDAINGFYPLNNETYLSLGSINSEFEFRFINHRSGECIEFGEYPVWTEINVEQPFQRFMTYLKSCVVHSESGRFAVFYARFKRFRIYSNKGKLLKDINVKVDPYSSDIEADFMEQMSYYMGQPVAIGNCIYALCGNRKENDLTVSNPKNELQVWDWEGNPIACYQLDKRVSSFAISEKYNKMYAFDGLTENEIYIYDLPSVY